ncbi:hypothetical protein YC2023_065813 [Brassica napus]
MILVIAYFDTGTTSSILKGHPSILPLEFMSDERNEAEDEHWHELARPQVHGHDINCVAMVQGSLPEDLQVDVQAQFASMAEIWRWEVGTWKAVGRLQSHSLDSDTLGRFSLEYCPLSLCLSLSSLINSDKTMARLVTNSWQKVEAQKRIIWACSWRPFGHQFATSSRDKTLKIWPFERKMLGSNRFLLCPSLGAVSQP